MKSPNVLLIIYLLLHVLAGCGPRQSAITTPSEAPASQSTKLVSSESPTGVDGRLAKVLADNLHGRMLDAEVNAAWQIMHGVICYGRELPLKTPDRGVTSALDYALTGGQIMGFELMPGSHVLDATGRLGMKARLEPGSYVGQGHVDQWIAIFAMADISLDTPVQVGDEQFQLVDWVRQAQHDVSQNMLDEYSWTLIALTHYFPDEPTWATAGGQEASWEMLVERELEYDLSSSPCGGTHRLSGITRALRAKERLDLPDSPVWSEAERVVEDSLRKAKEFRGPGGQLSSYYFERPGATADLTAELASAGHVLEFVALAAPREELEAEWVQSAVHRVCHVLELGREADLDCGALYHGLNGLKIYEQRRRDEQ